jgi:hypothetical protein
MLQFGLQLTTYLVYQYLKCHVGVWLQFINGYLGLKLENVQIDMFGSAKVTISKDGTIIHDGGGGDKKGIGGRCKVYTST